MKYIISLLLFIFPTLSFAADYVPRVTVTGMAKQEVAPDEMNWMLSIEHRDKDLESLASRHASSTSNILNLLKELGVEKKTLKASQMRFSENWEYLNRSRVKSGYIASTSISFTLRDFTRYLRVWQKLSQFEEASVRSVNYSHSKYDELVDSIKNKALLDAKNKANSMAKTLGVKLGQVIYIADSAAPSMLPPTELFGAAMSKASSSLADSSGPVEPGVIEIRSIVRVDYRILGQ